MIWLLNWTEDLNRLWVLASWCVIPGKTCFSISVAFLDNLAGIASLDLVLSYRKATDKGSVISEPWARLELKSESKCLFPKNQQPRPSSFLLA